MESDKVFAGPVPQVYDRYLGPILFQPYAELLAGRLDATDQTILETAAGTGIVTRALASAWPASSLVATDLNQAMLDVAAARLADGRVTWRQADAQALPFADSTFDVVVSSFGVMFMPDKQAAYREAQRVLKPGRRFIFTVWDRIDANPLMAIADETVAGLFPEDPPHFLARTPCGYHDKARIERDLREAGFRSVTIEEARTQGAVADATHPATGCCQGSPLRGEIEARDPNGLMRATDATAAAITARFGAGPFHAPMQALVVTAA
ncbi:methyltransferase domain-containing protein [Kaistia dalseonensis]|uniref:Ubiquinone/menaquinone biosynthesis C-methylase UbiE n=1 Tax=Kaistia dalseonensis TaxID=410840 RepID=A0ABU0H0Z7_9HYPH|nr:methyltransferase domain-containing protein [Kaistia dalseonensis]MCX5493419.1 methyltransferase domain-containing protein [Kaistia dalseonensis]MDQ0435978.1 ubiquinone/menaquinone biosynthesis C-methylase UbiE [Kaistia dalseonensis]